MNIVTMSAIIVTLFLGGPRGPLLIGPEWLWPPIWFLVKLVAFLFLQSGSGPRCPASATTS